LLREKTYGNADQAGYVDWLCQFAPLVHRVLKSTGSYVIDLGGAYYSLFHMTLHSFIGPVTLIGVVVFRQDAPYG
jgi:hypothetical protein